MAEITKALVDAVGRELIERGLIIQAGWAGYKLAFPPTSEAGDERERRAFAAGAAHLFASIMNSGLDEGVEPTEADMRRMSNIAAEVKAIEDEMVRLTSH